MTLEEHAGSTVKWLELFFDLVVSGPAFGAPYVVNKG